MTLTLKRISYSSFLIYLFIFSVSCLSTKDNKRTNYKLPNIDLNHWSVTIPIGENGKPISIQPPEILNYANNKVLKPFFYNDSVNGALVFHAYPSLSTPNSKYSRSELREQIKPGDNNVNWTFSQGASFKGELKVAKMSKDKNGKYHRTMVMQIHGRLTNEQRDLIGQKDNNAPPVLKIYWDKGKVRVKTKELKYLEATDTAILDKKAWTDDEGFSFEEKVDFNKFELDVKVSYGKIEVTLNNKQTKVYKNEHLKRWDIFENYFKAGNYLVTTDKGAFATVKYYNLEVKH